MRLRKAFTLIELLVVIATTAITGAILPPVFAQTKEAAKASLCLSDLKPLGSTTPIRLGGHHAKEVRPIPLRPSPWLNGCVLCTTRMRDKSLRYMGPYGPLPLSLSPFTGP